MIFIARAAGGGPGEDAVKTGRGRGSKSRFNEPNSEVDEIDTCLHKEQHSKCPQPSAGPICQ